MPITKKLIIIAIIIIVTVIFLNKERFLKSSASIKASPPSIESINQLQIISTNPNPLDGATVLPTQSIEITFNKPIVRSEFKYKLDPETAHQLTVVEGSDPNKDIGQTFKITFRKPLELGKGYTLFVLPGTHTENGLKFDKHQNFTFHTINYRGI